MSAVATERNASYNGNNSYKHYLRLESNSQFIAELNV